MKRKGNCYNGTILRYEIRLKDLFANVIFDKIKYFLSFYFTILLIRYIFLQIFVQNRQLSEPICLPHLFTFVRQTLRDFVSLQH